MVKGKRNIETVQLFEPNLQGKDKNIVSTQLASQRTGLSFQRTRLGADRTLMAVVRTALSLISFGFTIFQFFHHIKSEITKFAPREPKLFGFALVLLGILLLISGITYHARFMLQVRKERSGLIEAGLVPTKDTFPVSFSLVIAVLLLILGIASIISMYLQFH